MRRRLWQFLVLSGIIVLGFASSSRCQTPIQAEPSVGNFFGTGARALAMGGAHIAVVEDVSALFWNPAGLSRIRRIELSGGLTHERVAGRSTYLSTSSSRRASHTRLNAVGFALPVPTYRGSLVFGAGWFRLGTFDFVLKLNGIDGQIQRDALELRSGGLHVWTLGGAVDISPTISAGASLLLWRGEEIYQWNSSEDGPDATIIIDDRFTDSYSGANLKLGLLIRLGQYLTIGTTLGSPIKYTIEEDGVQSTKWVYKPSGSWDLDEYKTYFEYEFSLPYHFSGGLALTLPRLIVAVDVDYADWSQMEYEEPDTMVDLNRYIADYYQDKARWHVGAEYLLPLVKAKLRAGYYRDPIPFRSDEIDDERDFLTVGIGFLVDQIMTVDVAWVHGLWKRSGSNLKEEYEADRVFLSTAYRF